MIYAQQIFNDSMFVMFTNYVTGFPRAKCVFKLALKEGNVEVRLYLKVVLKFFDVELLIIQTNFQKSRLGWPQQPPTKCNFCS